MVRGPGNPVVRRLAVLLAAGATGLAAQPEDGMSGQRELIERALGGAGLAMAAVRIPEAEMALRDRTAYRAQLHRALFENPWRISSTTRVLAAEAAGTGLLGAVNFVHARADAGIRYGLGGDRLAAERATLAEAGERGLALALSRLTGRSEASFTTREYGQVPPEARAAAALVLLAAAEALEARRLALVEPLAKLGLDPRQTRDRVADLVIEKPDGEGGRRLRHDIEAVLLVESLVEAVDWPLLNRGAAHGALAVEAAVTALRLASGEIGRAAFRYEAETPLGRVVLSGASDDTHPAGGYLLLLDTGGADRYLGAGGADVDHPFSVVIDLAGDDTCEQSNPRSPAFGGAVFGYAYHVDAAGDDRYSTRFAGQGFGLFGTGALWDLDGDDRYDGVAHVQGSGAFGSGCLVDARGADRYHAYRCAQGYGFTRGSGLLVDGAGDDAYIADDEDLIYTVSAYGPDHNLSLSQGMGKGLRADYGDGHSWAGGVGFLVDGGGDDLYWCGIYGQGAGYWYGAGFLVDRGGHDEYRSVQYATGAGPHFALGVLQDDAGDDRYLVTRRQSLGHGRDFSIGWVEDSGGDDYYNAPGSTLGEGNRSSIGLFWDKSGDDTYVTQGVGLGFSRPEHRGRLRDDLTLCLGLFVDGGGADRYLRFPIGPGGSREGYLFAGDLEALPRVEFAGDGRTWVQEHERRQATSFAVGVDAE